MAGSFKYPIEDYGDGRYIVFRAFDYKVSGELLKPKTTEIPLDKILLYYPGSMSENIEQEWNEEVGSLAGLGSTMINKFKDKLGSAGGLLKNYSGGYTTNKPEVLLYKGPTLRTFPFSFSFTPKSATEAKVVRQILMSFKRNSLPEEVLEGAGIKFPSIWKIDFGSSVDGKFQQIDFGMRNKTFALSSYSADYAPEGSFTTFTDGMPVKINLSLTFKETTPLYKADIKLEDEK